MLAKILVVDDEPDLEQLVTQKFRKQIRDKDYEFSFAQNGVEALKILANDHGIDLVLTDINMPEMDGLTLLSRMIELNKPLLRSVIVSAYGDMENIRTAMNRGAYDFVVKPIDLRDLEITINKCLTDLHLVKEAYQSRENLIAIQQELDIANIIQTSILPKNFPAFPNRKEFDIHASMIPAKQVGGDFYDFFLIGSDRLGFAIGDVSGKGIPAALFMAVSKTLLKATALKGMPPEECLKQVNHILYMDSISSMFVTLFYGILDTTTGRVTYCNGGHNLPYLLRADGRIEITERTGGLVLGAIENATHNSKTLELQHGDSLFLYTDGITEAINQNTEEFGENRLSAGLQGKSSLSLSQLIDDVIADVLNFAAGMPQADDITILTLRYN